MGETCIPVSANPVVLWSKVAVVQLTVVWQVAQLAAANMAPAAVCGGALVLSQSVKWQPEIPQAGRGDA